MTREIVMVDTLADIGGPESCPDCGRVVGVCAACLEDIAHCVRCVETGEKQREVRPANEAVAVHVRLLALRVFFRSVDTDALVEAAQEDGEIGAARHER